MKLNSKSFENQAKIPARYAFGKPDGANQVTLSDNINPHLSWADVPEGTRSFVVLCADHDVPSSPEDVNQEGREVPAKLPRVSFYHWVLVDLPASTAEIAEGAYSNGVTPRGKAGPLSLDGTRQGLNDYTQWFAADHDMSGDYFGYDGPCPPWNDSIRHNYVFTVYALDLAELPLQGKFTGDEVLAAIQGHVLAEASLSGWYTLNPRVA